MSKPREQIGEKLSGLAMRLERPAGATARLYEVGSRPDIRVPYREIAQSPTARGDSLVPNPPIPLYDTSGPFGDPAISIDLTRGLAPIRSRWIEERVTPAKSRTHPRGRASWRGTRFATGSCARPGRASESPSSTTRAGA
ncbi:thiamine biosynthesis protein ThiC [mine drainage metagenome]|uniref:Thiamine biosynthesis protein ThiC n=1 Tax=mine drainage metagenome TaxID=410659 RepID=T1D567_9ZZZZ